MDFDGLEDTLAGGWRQFISDGEGPIAKNDNAYEMCKQFIKNGSSFFRVISRYDDILADVLQRPNYKAGDTLKLILPFLKAAGATDTNMVEYSRNNILTVPGAKKTMRFVQEFMSPFIVSTSYEHYISALCDAIGFPMENTYCTALDMDAIKIDDWETDILIQLAEEIARIEPMKIPEGARSIDEFSVNDQTSIKRLNDIFWEEMTDLSAYQLILEVNPVGGEEKASAVFDIRRRTGIGLEDTMYLGDSITDVQALQLVKEGGGLSIAFNGNEYAIREADIAVISEDTIVTSILAETFHRAGIEGINTLLDDWSMSTIKRSGFVNEYLAKEFERVFPDQLPILARVTPQNIEELTVKSKERRSNLRGEIIGALG